MFKRLIVSLALFAFLVSSVPLPAAAPRTPGGSPELGSSATPAKPANELKIALMDGSLLNGKISVSEFTIDTHFGTLKVPIDQIQALTPGLQSHPQFQQNLTSLINDLGSDLFAVREKAQQALTKLGPEIRPELDRQTKGVDSEKASRLQKIIEDLDALRDDDFNTSHDWARDDVIVTPGFTIVGHITTPGFSVAGSYGTLQIKIDDIREVRRDTPAPEDIRKSLAVPGASIAQHNFVNTGIKLNKGDQVTITASGSIVMTPFGGNRQSSPDGAPNIGGNVQGMPLGTLVARVGENPAFLKVGSKCTWTADKSGTFFLGIACPEEYSSYSFPGEYAVKIHVVKKN
jgi:hypothetical protein